MILDSGLLFWATLYTRGTFTEISKKSHRRVVGLLNVNKECINVSKSDNSYAKVIGKPCIAYFDSLVCNHKCKLTMLHFFLSFFVCFAVFRLCHHHSILNKSCSLFFFSSLTISNTHIILMNTTRVELKLVRARVLRQNAGPLQICNMRTGYHHKFSTPTNSAPRNCRSTSLTRHCLHDGNKWARRLLSVCVPKNNVT